MAHTWTDGEIITAEKLNTLEGRIGFDVGEGSTVIEEEITTMKESESDPYAINSIKYSDFINADVLNIIFNGVEYSLEKKTIPNADGSFYGDMENNEIVFNNYPFAIYSSTIDYSDRNQFATSSPGTYDIKITISTKSIETNNDFEQAVKKFGLKNIKDGEGIMSITEGFNTTASGDYSHAEGAETTASGDCSHAEGNSTRASRDASHAEGGGTTASRLCSHAEGNDTTASGDYSHAEGNGTTASGQFSHAEGNETTASGMYSHAQNYNTIAQGKSQTVIGEFNVAQGTIRSKSNTDYAFIIGNGTSGDDRSNAFAIKWDGTFVFANGTEITPAEFMSLKNLLGNQIV